MVDQGRKSHSRKLGRYARSGRCYRCYRWNVDVLFDDKSPTFEGSTVRNYLGSQIAKITITSYIPAFLR